MSRSINSKMFSSERQDWETPQALFDELNREFHFCLDAAASKENHKVLLWYTEEQDGLTSEWFNPTWCNPPYGRDVGKWVHKAYMESLRGVTSVLLLAALTDTAWFHDWVYGKAEIRFIRGRITFVGADNSAPFPSMIVIYRGKED